LLSFLEKTNIEKIGPGKIDDEIRRMTRDEDWCNLVDDPDSEGGELVIQDRRKEARETIIAQPHLHTA
jgi:hypothetical protein